MAPMDPLLVEDSGVVYPDSDGQPMADNEQQLEVILLLATGFRHHYAAAADVHVASDLLWYPVEGHPEICAAPDVMVISGCGKELLPSYRQWTCGGQPTLVIEVLSPRNSAREMLAKLVFYDTHGATEYLVFDPASGALLAWERQGAHLVPVATEEGWVSPSAQVRFTVDGDVLMVTGPDGRRWAMPEEERRRADAAEAQVEAATARAEAEAARAGALEGELAALRAQVAALTDDEAVRPDDGSF
jgi:Uma2 family endonuclease